jgi:eukaryotic-like serine/threonine-protein kinase
MSQNPKELLPADKIESIFVAAVALPNNADRSAYVEQACGGDENLRGEVEALLRAHDRANHLLDRPVPANLQQTTPFSASGQHGTVIAGRYTLLESIGEGGMGEVWAAKQTEPVRRKVAVKLIKAGMDSKAVLTRFEQERQALAMMDHPNISRVLDGGLTNDHRPYFVMELVNGLPLNKFCDEARLGIRERLELFVQICQAVQHAHQKGIIHRDLKPSNILVTIIDGRPVPKIIDFGVAKATSGRLTNESLYTQFGAVVGTLEYMSPEQAGYSGVDIDTRSDIYSLGVILYELLTGLRPIDTARLKEAALTEMIRIIREEEPSRPSKRLSTDASLPSLAALRQTEPKRLMSLLRGELDWVVMKCLEKQRDRRYETAGALSRDVLHYLADEPVEARPPTVGYQLLKLLHRHKGQVIVASMIVLALLAVTGTVIVAGMYAHAERERLSEAEATRIATEQRMRAERLKSAAENAAQEAATSKEQVRQVLYSADIQLAWNHWDTNQAVRMRDVLQRHNPAAGEQDYRGFEWHYLWRLANSSQRTLRGHAHPIDTLAFAGSADVLLSGDVEYQYRSPGVLRKWRLGQTDKPDVLLTQKGSPEYGGIYPGIRSLATSPDGARCALVDAGVVRVLEVGTVTRSASSADSVTEPARSRLLANNDQ